MAGSRTFERFLGGAAVVMLAACGGNGDPEPPTTALKSACAMNEAQALLTAAMPVDDVLSARVTAVRQMPGTATVPEHCQLDVAVATPGNADTSFRLGLPSTWNRKFYFVGGGGFAGTIGSLSEGLARNYATATTNQGHVASTGSNGQPDVSDGQWAYLDEPKRIDYAYRATKVASDLSRGMIAAAYGEPHRHAYFVGCSNGGRQGLIAAQRASRDFDGVIARDPVISLSTGFDWVQRSLLASPASYIPIEKYRLFRDRVVAQCDAADGVTDGLVSDPASCPVTPSSLQCSGADAPTCLTAAQVSTFDAILGGPRRSDGTSLFVGYPLPTGSDEGWRFWMAGGAFTPASLSPVVPDGSGRLTFVARDLASQQWRLQTDVYRYFVFDNPSYDLHSFDYDTQYARLQTAQAIYNPESADLTGFRQGGGKLIITHGWSDQLMSPLRSIQYHQQLTQATGPTTKDFARLFMLPGVNHCRAIPGDLGSSQDDALVALEQWVEQGSAPDRISSRRIRSDASVQWTRPLCPHPLVAAYSGTGPTAEEASFVCR